MQLVHYGSDIPLVREAISSRKDKMVIELGRKDTITRGFELDHSEWFTGQIGVFPWTCSGTSESGATGWGIELALVDTTNLGTAGVINGFGGDWFWFGDRGLSIFRNGILKSSEATFLIEKGLILQIMT